ncbi:hypothetical protein PO909_008576 [Leuciscus waleckii]
MLRRRPEFDFQLDITATLELLCGNTFFTKLDLKSVYNLNHIWKGDEWKTAYVTHTGHYDNILGYSQNLAEHLQHFVPVLEKLWKCHLYLNMEKCTFHQASTQFLGYHISAEGIKMDEGKVEALLSWFIPTTIKEVQLFMSFANFYRRFIKNRSSITATLSSLLKSKPKSLSWSQDATHSFQRLKCAITILIETNPLW